MPEPKIYELVPVDGKDTVIDGFKTIFIRELPPTDGIYVLLIDDFPCISKVAGIQNQWEEKTQGKHTPLLILAGLKNPRFVRIRELFREE